MATVNAAKARSICTAAEYAVIRDSAPARITDLTAAQLRTAVARARKLRDKQRALAERQRREARGKADPRKKGGKGNPAGKNKNTLLKLEIFQLALDRFEKQLGKTAPGGRTATTKPRTAPARKKSAKAPSPKPASKPAKSSAKTVSPKSKADKNGTTATLKPKARKVSRVLLSKAGGLPTAGQSAAAALAARQTAYLAESERSAPSRHANILANTANARIRGHARGAHRRAQARRDAVQRVGRDPNVKPGRKEP